MPGTQYQKLRLKLKRNINKHRADRLRTTQRNGESNEASTLQKIPNKLLPGKAS